MNQNGSEQIKTYLIPNNFIDESRVFNGALRTRFVVEAVIVFLLLFVPCWVIIPSTVNAKIGICLGCSLPLAIAALAGINDDSLITFIKNARNWRKSKEIMLYNDDAQTYKARPVDIMMSEVNASDMVMTVYSDWKAKRAQKNADVELIEGVDFEFRDDTEYHIMVPKDMRNARKNERQLKKQEKRDAKEAALQAKIESKRQRQEEKAAAIQAKQEAKAAIAQAKIDAKLAKKQAKAEAQLAKVERQAQAALDKKNNAQNSVSVDQHLIPQETTANDQPETAIPAEPEISAIDTSIGEDVVVIDEQDETFFEAIDAVQSEQTAEDASGENAGVASQTDEDKLLFEEDEQPVIDSETENHANDDETEISVPQEGKQPAEDPVKTSNTKPRSRRRRRSGKKSSPSGE